MTVMLKDTLLTALYCGGEPCLVFTVTLNDTVKCSRSWLMGYHLLDVLTYPHLTNKNIARKVN